MLFVGVSIQHQSDRLVPLDLRLSSSPERRCFQLSKLWLNMRTDAKKSTTAILALIICPLLLVGLQLQVLFQCPPPGTIETPSPVFASSGRSLLTTNISAATTVQLERESADTGALVERDDTTTRQALNTGRGEMLQAAQMESHSLSNTTILFSNDSSNEQPSRNKKKKLERFGWRSRGTKRKERHETPWWKLPQQPPNFIEPSTGEYEVPSRHYPARPASNKTHLVFHVGPPKTGTTTLQTELTNLEAALAEDNYFYAGRYYHPYTSLDGSFHLNRSESVLHDVARTMLKRRMCQKKPRTRCLEKFQQELNDNYRGRNVVLSDETWGAQVWKTWEDYHTIQQVLGEEWQVTVVVGYRPFFQWIRSQMFQRYRMDRPIDWKDDWPGQGFGESVRTLFPDYHKYDKWYNDGHRFTDLVVHNTKGRVHVRVMSLVQGTDSLRTKFACQMLPDAHHACAESRRLDDERQEGDEIMLNTREKVSHVHYDMLATQAVELGRVDPNRHSRVEVRKALHRFAETELGMSPMELDLACPTQEELDELLDLSLALERECLGVAWARQTEADTRKAFQEDVGKKVFCWVDANSTLSKEPWMSFLNRFSKSEES